MELTQDSRGMTVYEEVMREEMNAGGSVVKKVMAIFQFSGLSFNFSIVEKIAEEIIKIFRKCMLIALLSHLNKAKSHRNS